MSNVVILQCISSAGFLFRICVTTLSAPYFGGVARGFGASDGFRQPAFVMEHRHLELVGVHHTSESAAVFL